MKFFSKENLLEMLRVFRSIFVNNHPLNDEVGPNNKLLGIDYVDVVAHWISINHSNKHIIALHNINVEAKNIKFWAKVPQTDIKYFLKDVVLLRCKDIPELTRLINNISEDFADAYGYSKGVLIHSNKEGVA